MHVGHFAAGMIARHFDTKISLGTFILAAMLADFLWCVFMLAGAEQVQFKTVPGAANYFEPLNIAWSHSLVMDVIWATLFAAAYFLWRRNTSAAGLLFVIVLSHWPLDVIAHRPDMPLAPVVESQFGLGLWTNIPATIIVEGGLWLLGVILYIRTTKSKRRFGPYVFWGVVLLLTLLWYNNIAGPPPPDPRIAPLFSLVYFSLVVAWAYWMNRLRPARE
ncbi:MAG TPA: hypothetical protein VF074_22245 [Pyrinomonadaceae bacterium]